MPNEITQAEMQDDVARFEGRFSDRIQNALAPLEAGGDPNVRRSALGRELAYLAAALDIAAGVDPIANLLDMLTFVELASERFRNHWRPRVFGEAGRSVEKALQEAVVDIRTIAAKYMNPDQTRRFDLVLGRWRDANRDQIEIEAVRLSAFSWVSGLRAEQEKQEAKGLFGELKRGTRTVESTRLLGDRALYLLQRTPSLLRLHARVAGSDLYQDLKQNLAGGETSDLHALRERVESSSAHLMTRGLLMVCGAVLFAGLVYVGAKRAAR